MVHRAILALILFVGLAGPVVSQEEDIQTVINGQLKAFQMDDFETAFTYASPMIKSLVGSPENFRRMVVGGYPMVYRPKTVVFGKLFNSGGTLVQSITIEDQDGRFYDAQYEMIQTKDGWKINGVYIEEPRAMDT